MDINSLKFTKGLFALKSHETCNKGNKVSLNPLLSKTAFSAQPAQWPCFVGPRQVRSQVQSGLQEVQTTVDGCGWREVGE